MAEEIPGMSLQHQRRPRNSAEHRIFRGAEILRNEILQQIDAMEGYNKEEQQPGDDGWWSQDYFTSSFAEEKKWEDEEDEVRRHGSREAPDACAKCLNNDVAAADGGRMPAPIIDLSKSYQLRAVSGLPVNSTTTSSSSSANHHPMVQHQETAVCIEQDDDDSNHDTELEATNGTIHSEENLFGMSSEAARQMVLVDDPETFTFTNDKGAQQVVPIVSPEEKRQDNTPSYCAYSDYRQGDKDQARRIIAELRGSGSSVRHRRRPQQSDSRTATTSRSSSTSRPEQAPQPQKIYTKRSSSPPRLRPISTTRTRSSSSQRQHQAINKTRSLSRRRSSYVPLPDTPDDNVAKYTTTQQQNRQKPGIYHGASLLDQDEGSSSVERPVTRATRPSRLEQHLQKAAPTFSQLERYQQLFSDPAYVHAMQAGFLWQSLVGQHMKFPTDWWGPRSRGPPMMSTRSSSSAQSWVYLGRQSVLDNFVLNKLVRSRASGGRLLLHIVVQDVGGTYMDIALGCFHPNAKEIRDTPQALRTLEKCRDVWIAVQKHHPNGRASGHRNTLQQQLDALLAFPDRSSRSPLGPGVRINNSNVRAVFGEKPPLETLLVTQEEMSRRLAPRILRQKESPPLAVLHEFVFA